MLRDLFRQLFSRLPERDIQWMGNGVCVAFEDAPEIGFDTIVQRVHSLCRQALERSARGVLDRLTTSAR